MDYFVTEIDRAGTVAVDDTLLVKGFETKAGSHILDGFVPLFSADAVDIMTYQRFWRYGQLYREMDYDPHALNPGCVFRKRRIFATASGYFCL